MSYGVIISIIILNFNLQRKYRNASTQHSRFIQCFITVTRNVYLGIFLQLCFYTPLYSNRHLIYMAYRLNVYLIYRLGLYRLYRLYIGYIYLYFITPKRVCVDPTSKPLTTSLTNVLIELKFVSPILPDPSRTNMMSAPAEFWQPKMENQRLQRHNFARIICFQTTGKPR
jgi:hypothetical protein